MSAIGILRLICAAVAASILVVKLVHKDYHASLYWALVVVYWTMAFIEHISI